MSELLLGCGNRREKVVVMKGTPKVFMDLTTCDMDPAAKPDIVHDLNVTPWPFASDAYDEVHAYEVMEHIGQQGDWRAFFAHFGEIWRILKPGGLFCATVPMWTSPWAWGDPGHTRVIPRHSLVFLQQKVYELSVGSTAMTDYRHTWKGDFDILAIEEGDISKDQHLFGFILKAIK